MLDGTMVVVATYDVAAAMAEANRLATWKAAENPSPPRVPTWSPGASWQVVDHALRTIQRVRDGLDAEEARWLRDAERLQIWRELGMVSALDYCERVLGLAPRTGKDRLRVARALASLPAIEDALAQGHLNYSVVRELTRVATSATEAAWLERASGKSLREVEQLVVGRRLGDQPTDPPDPSLRTLPFVLALTPRVRTLVLAAIAKLRSEVDRDLEDDDIAEAMARAVLGGGEGERESGRAAYQVAVTVCERCEHAEQQAGGYTAAIDPPTLDRVRCDAVELGALDATTPARATQAVPPAIRRLVWHRDEGICQTPGCRSKRGLEVHHIVRRADGGSHDPSNLTLRCSSCHQAHHDGLITIGGVAPDRLTCTRAVWPPESVRARAGTVSVVLQQATDAIVRLGFTRSIARNAVDAAREHAEAGLPTLLRAALALCPRPCH